ncbi:MAG: cytochrome c oxidase assembly protein [Actinomycetota bacterium]|nr:cytochrome c oxidase assembly protein [Actinomycetota bacterium]
MTSTLLASVRDGDPWALHIHVDVFLVVAALVIAYVEGIRRLGPSHAPAGAPYATRRQRVQFGVGALVMFVFAFWPIHDIAEGYLFSVHMIQHTVFSLVVTPLLLLGTPSWLLAWLTRPLVPVLRKLCRPLPASLLFNGYIALSHAAGFVNFVSSHEVPHFLAHVALVTTAAVMWLPVVHDLPGIPTMSSPVKMLYLFGQSILPNVPTAFLAFAETPIYQWYALAPRISGMSAVEDQQAAGAFMKVGGTVIIWTTIVVMFFRWYQRSERDQGDVLTWDDVERELAKSPAREEPVPNP